LTSLAALLQSAGRPSYFLSYFFFFREVISFDASLAALLQSADRPSPQQLQHVFMSPSTNSTNDQPSRWMLSSLEGIYVCMYIYMYIHAYTYTHMQVHIYVHVHICMYIRMYIYIYIYVYIYRNDA